MGWLARGWGWRAVAGACGDLFASCQQVDQCKAVQGSEVIGRDARLLSKCPSQCFWHHPCPAQLPRPRAPGAQLLLTPPQPQRHRLSPRQPPRRSQQARWGRRQTFQHPWWPQQWLQRRGRRRRWRKWWTSMHSSASRCCTPPPADSAAPAGFQQGAAGMGCSRTHQHVWLAAAAAMWPLTASTA